MTIGRYGTPLRPSAITPKFESASLARESPSAVGAACVVCRQLTRAMVAFLGHRVVARIRSAVARAASRAPAGHLRPRAAFAQEPAIVGRANPLVFDSAFPPRAGTGPTSRDDRNGDRSEDNGDSRRSSTQGPAGICDYQTRTWSPRKARRSPKTTEQPKGGHEPTSDPGSDPESRFVTRDAGSRA
jgi:hypothetical protein